MSGYLAKQIDIANNPASNIDYFKVLMSLQVYASPAEWRDFIAATDGFSRGTADFRTLVGDLHKLVSRHGEPMQMYERVHLSNSVSHYRGSGRPGKMLVAFCGRAQVLFGPIARILQLFPVEDYEVLVLRDTLKLGFTQGLPEHSSTFPEMIGKLRQEFFPDPEKEIFCLGTSGGGGPALVAATLLSARSGVGFSGRPPTSSKVYGESAGAKAMADVLHQRRAQAGQRLVAVYPAEHADDVATARQLAEMADVELMPMAGLSDHNVLHDLHLRGDLAAVLRNTGLVT